MRPPRHVRRIAAVSVVILALGLSGCGKSDTKPSTIAGCDAPSDNDDNVRIRMVVKELRHLGIVTGEPRASQFAALFDGDRIKNDGEMVWWITQHEDDRDLAFYGAKPSTWETLLLDAFPKPNSAYRAYCTGWSLADYARTHPLPAWAVVTPATPTASTPSSAAATASPS
jgi:hypothetical protein